MKKIFLKKNLILIALSVVVIAESVFVATSNSGKMGSWSEGQLREMAAKVLAKCQKKEFAPNCYDEEIPKLMDTISMEEAFEVTRFVQEKDERYLFCHVLAHKLSYIEIDRNPADWRDVLARCPKTMCNNGCPHGALMRKFNRETLTDNQIEEVIPDLVDVCEPRGDWDPAEVERSMCYHAIGHLGMFISGANVEKSLDICERVGIKEDGRNYYQTCMQGVYMTIYQPLEPEDYAIVKDIQPQTKQEVYDLCSQYSGDNFVACRTEAWPIFKSEIVTPQGAADFCSFTKEPFHKIWCWGTVLNYVAVELIRDGTTDKLRNFCLSTPDDVKQRCFAGITSRLVQIDPKYATKAISLCESVESLNLSGICMSDLLFYSRYSFNEGSAAQTNYCNTFREPNKTKCLNGDVPTWFNLE